MTSSGTYSFSPSNGQIVLSAFERIQIHAPSIRTEHLVTAGRELNFLLVEIANKTPNLWKVEQLSIALTQGTATYPLPARTVMVLDGWITTTQGGQSTDRYITQISRTDYASIANKAVQGAPTQIWMNRLITPTVTFFPVPDANGPYTFNYFNCVQVQDANLPGGETPDVPYRWLDYMTAGLAYRLARVYAPTLEALRKADATEAWDIAAAQDTEAVNLSIAPPIGNYYPR
jgi:hypothetical protein